MSSKETKRKQFSVEEKIAIIARLEAGEKNSTIASEYAISSSTISTIWKYRSKIQQHFLDHKIGRKKIKTCAHPDIEQELSNWCKYQQSEDPMKLPGQTLLKKAEEIARELGKTDFVCTLSWVNRFKRRNRLALGCSAQNYFTFNTLVNVFAETANTWLQNTWPELRAEYVDEEIFTLGETGLYYNMSPVNLMDYKPRKTGNNIKMIKDRLTILIAANMTGDRKLKLLAISKFSNPLSEIPFAEHQPFVYEQQKQSCLNAEIFDNYILNWDQQLLQKNKKILLILEQNIGNLDPTQLHAIKLAILPRNTARLLHPMQQGIIKYLKIHYRHMYLLEHSKEVENNQQISVLQALLLLSKAWGSVSTGTICSCFAKCGLLANESNYNDELETDDQLFVTYADNYEKFSQNIQFNEFLQMEEHIKTITKSTDSTKSETLVEAVYSDTETIPNVGKYVKAKPEVQLTDALKAAQTLKEYFSSHYISGEAIKQALLTIDETLDNQSRVVEMKVIIKEEPELDIS